MYNNVIWEQFLNHLYPVFKCLFYWLRVVACKLFAQKPDIRIGISTF